MELTKEQTIFSKMGVAYDQLRNAPDSIEIVRKYYREKAIKAKKKAMPWWLGTSAEGKFGGAYGYEYKPVGG